MRKAVVLCAWTVFWTSQWYWTPVLPAGIPPQAWTWTQQTSSSLSQQPAGHLRPLASSVGTPPNCGCTSALLPLRKLTIVIALPETPPGNLTLHNIPAALCPHVYRLTGDSGPPLKSQCWEWKCAFPSYRQVLQSLDPKSQLWIIEKKREMPKLPHDLQMCILLELSWSRDILA